MIDGEVIRIRDQTPLHKGNLSLPPSWSYEDLVELLNDRVFFWPGDADGPIDYGERHFAKYAGEFPVVLRVPTADVLAANPGAPPEFSRYNSGSPRWSGGRPSPRGPDTFLGVGEFGMPPSRVVEVAFASRVRLPDRTEIADGASGPWQPFFNE